MKNFEEAIVTFINKMGYYSNPDVLGIVFYGSYLTGYSHNKSDIDLHIIMRNEIKVLIRGASVDNDFKTEYFEKPISDLYLSADNDFLTQDNALVPIIGYGKILYDPTGAVKDLQDYILEKYSHPLPPLEADDAKEEAVTIANKITALQMMFDHNQNGFNYIYGNIVRRIRKYYSRKLGCPDIPEEKVFKLYSNEDYRKAFCKSIIPDKEFIKMFFMATNDKNSKSEKMEHIHNLYDYTTKDLDLDPNNYRIMIKSRNNPLNKIHD